MGLCTPIIEGNQTAWLVVWTANNIVVTMMNKMAFANVDFQYPFTLSAIHMLCNWIGAQLYMQVVGVEYDTDPVHPRSPVTVKVGAAGPGNIFGRVSRRVLDLRGQLLIFAFSFIFSMNIGIGNVSLRYVSVNFNQVMRSLVPALTIAFSIITGKSISQRRKVAVLPVVCGVAMACYGDMSYTPLGFFITCLCVLFAALKVVASGLMLTGSLKLHPVDLLSYMAPLALFECLIMASITGELAGISKRWYAELQPSVDIRPMAVCFGSGILAFSLNITSLFANKLTSPLTLCIAANVKQVLIIAVSTMFWRIPISFMNGMGIIVVLIGSARYSYVSVLENQTQTSKKKSTPIKNTGNEDLEKGDEVHSPKSPPHLNTLPNQRSAANFIRV
mmetsp:Transcript_18109/g.41239  ORF Transcript_18109/g.41239 Transcript_18109/m.41239 type:complete len:389 (-) Transcript_18109:1073-2239(-)|eukprot:CAMPEP_0113297298 /NCGR_PEP_ID=MMETSP0010_2-20120614/220_1 /TAXON_ID=216773 ORGANISM="Corethron hystrix, Strain 308" /NCGR_SAMPLE_ID=MMETSP0010_2 /ASSEMBLY_ACC=CAM_ASM_000155 /LENGTH=388 /DNA_ID=CAMNT_0000150167 /DNA_START=256 /DNA_END=1422 /DNA_ORIENTATION=- /assembly_acc=CAM_ASM_000155